MMSWFQLCSHEFGWNRRLASFGKVEVFLVYSVIWVGEVEGLTK